VEQTKLIANYAIHVEHATGKVQERKISYKNAT